MIPQIFLEQWKREAPWQSIAMIEQDLIISRALVDIYNHPIVAKDLVFRGGTALNKIYIKPQARYSEDIDLVQIEEGAIGEVIDAIRTSLAWLGEPKRKMTERSVKLIYRYTSIDETPSKLKIEINTTEHFHVEPLIDVEYAVTSNWFSGKSILKTYSLDELMATKLKALYQRRKGRDLFDLWLIVSRGLINPSNVLKLFDVYCAHEDIKITRALFEKSLYEKCQHTDFTMDMHPLLTKEQKWGLNEALESVQEHLISKLQGASYRLSEELE
ncbi:MAG: nucleotidyl transferase AbiEii/AbiGii toxin family protein [Candidatus Paracaedibacteraceae bacterium]|nr:nucleotidyl transferase AbiEii/AbiGii toxin family protein [Candidatus Paracaedibacteraceae bacterium]